ncbi:MAG: hypothetical protein WC915_06615 [archaeon]|jgi:hypothetical protein
MFNSTACVICKDSISDPVCRGCYLKQIEILLGDLNLDEITNKLILKKIKNKFPIETFNEIDCMLCRKDKVIICRYCFSIILIKILRDFNFTEEVIENFGYNQMYEENSLEKENKMSSNRINANGYKLMTF